MVIIIVIKRVELKELMPDEELARGPVCGRPGRKIFQMALTLVEVPLILFGSHRAVRFEKLLAPELFLEKEPG